MNWKRNKQFSALMLQRKTWTKQRKYLVVRDICYRLLTEGSRAFWALKGSCLVPSRFLGFSEIVAAQGVMVLWQSFLMIFVPRPPQKIPRSGWLRGREGSLKRLSGSKKVNHVIVFPAWDLHVPLMLNAWWYVFLSKRDCATGLRSILFGRSER